MGKTWLAVVALVAIGAAPVAAQSGYVVQDLGALPGDWSSVAWAINAPGDVVGWSNGANGTRAFLYTDGAGMVALTGLPDRPRTVARDINDAGDVVGSANAGGVDLGHAVLWAQGGPPQDLGTLGTGSYSEAWAVNNLGQIVGWSHIDGGSFPVHGFLYTPAGGFLDLTPASDTGYALDVNDAGQVTGYKTAFGGYHAYRWQTGTFEDLGVLSGFAHSFGWAINAFGVVAGASTSASGDAERFFRSFDGGLQDLGGTGQHNTAWGVNASGDVVGTAGRSNSRAIRYTDDGGLETLDALIDPSLGWVLLSAHDINDSGQIVGHAFNNFTEQTHAVRLQPTSTPPPDCTFHCLRSTSITLRHRYVRRTDSIVGDVRVEDENGNSVPEAMVAARWTHPDGSQLDGYAWTDSGGAARFTTRGSSGTYTLTVVSIQRSLYTFDPPNSVLSQTLAVTARK